jgi:hypothetical protein
MIQSLVARFSQDDRRDDMTILVARCAMNPGNHSVPALS